MVRVAGRGQTTDALENSLTRTRLRIAAGSVPPFSPNVRGRPGGMGRSRTAPPPQPRE